MNIVVRRSNLIVPITDGEMLAAAWRHNADAITLDLEDGVVTERNAEARQLVKAAIGPAARGAAEILIRVSKSSLQPDLEASIWPGVSGIMLAQVETSSDVTRAVAIMDKLERERGIATGSLQLTVLLESALGVWNIRSIIKASPRVTEVGLDESDLAAELGIAPHADYDPYVYARGRLAIEATAAKVRPVGMGYPLSVHPTLASDAEVHALAMKAKNLAMKGVICPHPSWIAPVNRAFTPTAELVAYNRRVREAFAAGVAAGTAAVPLDGRMIDVPVDEWAIVVLATAEACAKRDAQKQAALERSGQSAQR